MRELRPDFVVARLVAFMDTIIDETPVARRKSLLKDAISSRRIIMIFAAVLVQFPLNVLEGNAQGAANIARSAAGCTAQHAALYDKHSKASAQRMKELERIPDSDIKRLCEYGRNIGIPHLERQANEVKALEGDSCWDNIDKATQEAGLKILSNYKKSVEADCAKVATTQTGECVVLSNKSYNRDGTFCIVSENKCSYNISVEVLRIPQRLKAHSEISPGKTNKGDICTSQPGQGLQYVGWRKTSDYGKAFRGGGYTDSR